MKIGIVLCTHGDFASGLKSAVEMISGEQPTLKAICFHNDNSIEDLIERFTEADKDFQKNGIPYVIVTDMFGATPCNAALMFAAEYPCKIICGASLPLVLEILLGAQSEDGSDKTVSNEFLERCIKNSNGNVKLLDSNSIFTN